MTASANRVRIVGVDGGVDVTLAVCTKDEPTFGVEITEHPVEGGSATIDHARPKLIKLSLEGIVTVFDDEGNRDETRSTAAYTALTGLLESPQIVRVETPWRDYPEMLAEQGKPTRAKDLGKALKIAIDFKQYAVKNTKKKTVEIKQGKKVPKGIKKSEDVKPPRKVSLAKSGYKALNR